MNVAGVCRSVRIYDAAINITTISKESIKMSLVATRNNVTLKTEPWGGHFKQYAGSWL